MVEPVAKQIKPLLVRYSLPEGRIRIAQFQGVIPWLWIDKLMMQQVFFNLLTNAIKYRDRSDNFRIGIEARASPTEMEPEWYQIDVLDWGIGLDGDDEAPQRMFLPGVRGILAAKLKDPAGTGIGLSVVREIIESHGGTVGFVPNESQQNQYCHPTRVRISLPAALRNGRPQTS